MTGYIARRAAMRFDRDMGKTEVGGNPLLVFSWGCRCVGDNCDYRRVDVRADRPQVEVGNLAVGILFDAVLDPLSDAFRPLFVKQDTARGSQ